ncbi:P-loop containing nucleoside triphosphate hydrolase protein [Cyathus striatus]|nr:P-loop containing nucleoside triphosphate hydrolase protein [Cyathus striatus]
MQSEEQLSAFIQRQRILLTEEREAEIERSSLLLSNCGPRLLEQKGLSLGGLGIASVNIGLGGKTLVELERPTAYHSTPIFPPHTLRPGDLTRIEAHVASNATTKKAKKTTGVETKGAQVEGVVYKVSDTRIVVAVDPSDSGSDDLDLPERCRVLKLANSVTYDRRKEMKIELTPLIQVLMGMIPLSPRAPINNLAFFDPNLNPSQKEAVKFCLSSPEVACIHGPPGTGKTHTLIEIIRQLTTVTPSNPTSKRLLVCGASNLSKGEKLKVTRIGHPARVMAQEGILDSTLEVKATKTEQAALAKDVKNELETALGILSGKGKGVKGKGPRGAERKKMWDEVKALRKEYRQREGGVVKSVLSESQIVLATCHSSGGRQLYNQKFDVVIIDEATQAFEAVCWIPIFKSNKLILAGDPLQLPPTILSLDSGKKRKANPRQKPARRLELVPPRTLETTLFDRLEKMYGVGIKRMLEIQYRMHEQICTFPSKTLYYSKLKSHESVASHLLYDLPNASTKDEEDAKEFLKTPVVFFDTTGCEYFERVDGDGDEGSKCNENEAAVVKNWVEKLIEMGIEPGQIAIITPYQAQVTLLTSLLRAKYGPSLEIGTVDGMQGREKEAVIISLVRSNDTREVGFLKEKRRMNVAMTRAKRHLCVVGDSSTVVHGGRYLKKWLSWLEENADVKYAGLE